MRDITLNQDGKEYSQSLGVSSSLLLRKKVSTVFN